MIVCEYCENSGIETEAVMRVRYRVDCYNRWCEQDLCAECAKEVFNYEHEIVESYLP